MKKIIYTTMIIVFLFITLLIDYYFLNNNVSTNNYILSIMFLVINSLFCLFIITLIHELSHQMVAIILGMGLSIFVCYPFIISKGNDGWRFNINFRNIVEYSGYIIPNISIIKDKKAYNSNLRKLWLSILAGPISNILFIILCLKIPVNSVNFSYIIKIFIIISSLLVVSSLLYGDGPMLFLLLNKQYAIKSLLSMNNYSSHYYHNSYLYDIAKNQCKKIDFKNIHKKEIYQFEIQSYLIYNYLINMREAYPEIVKKNIEGFLHSEIKLSNLKPEIILYMHTIIIYLIVIKGDYSLGKELYNKNFFQYEELLKNHYLTQRTRFFLGFIDSYDKLIEMLENSFEYRISENNINIEKQFLYICNKKLIQYSGIGQVEGVDL